jgi:hypothetical protein
MTLDYREAMVAAGAAVLHRSPLTENGLSPHQWMGLSRGVIEAALSASPAPAGDLVERVTTIIRANMPGAPHDLASVNRTARAVIAAMQPVGWASEWQGLGGLARALHDTKEAADDNAEWMDGRSFALYALPAPPGVGS